MDTSKLIKLAKLLVKLENIKTDKGVLVISEDLAVGVAVLNEDGEAVEDGEYLTEDGTKLVVAEGKVAEIVAPEKEEDPEKPAGEEKKPEEEEMKKPCLEEEPKTDENQPQNQPEDKDAKIAELEGLLKDRDAIIEELTAKVKELEEQVASKPAEEALKMNKVETKKVDKTVIPQLKYFEN